MTPPAPVTAHVVCVETAIFVAPELSPITSTGAYRRTVVPSPRLPQSLRPQHLAAPSSVVAQYVWSSAEMLVTRELIVAIRAGSRELAPVPLPSSPCPPYPQHDTPPDA